LKDIDDKKRFQSRLYVEIQKFKDRGSRKSCANPRHLITLGLLDFVNSAKTGHLWTNLKYDEKHRYTHQFQKWFGNLNRKKITADPKKTFH
jgi:hypothetical protein